MADPPGGAVAGMVAAVSFDFTGTLARPRVAEVYAEVFARHGHPVDGPTLAAMVGEVWRELAIRTRLGEDRFRAHPEGAQGFWRELVGRVAARLDLPAPSPFLTAELYDRFAHADAWELYPEVRETLAALQGAGLRLAVVSNFDPRLPGLVTALGLDNAFAAVVYSAAVGVEKPHPAIFAHLLAALGLPASRVAHVGDRRREDVEGALGAGMHGLLVDRRGRRSADAGDEPLRDLRELRWRLGLVPAAVGR